MTPSSETMAPTMIFRMGHSPREGNVPSLQQVLCRGAVGALALVLFQEALAQADRLRRDLGELVVADEFHRVLEGELDRRREQDRLVLAGGADVGELLGADR